MADIGSPWLDATSWAINATVHGLQTHGVGLIFNLCDAIWTIVSRCKENRYQLFSLVKTATDYLDQLTKSSPPRNDKLLQDVLGALEDELERVLAFLEKYKAQNVSYSENASLSLISPLLSF